MNWIERFVFAAVILVGAGVVLFALSAIGVSLPFLAPAPSVDGSGETLDPAAGWDAPPAPRKPEEDRGLLADLASSAGVPAALDGRPDPVGAPGGPDAPDDGTAGAPEGDADGADPAANGARDPLIDKMKAAVDPANAGQLMAFLIATFRPHGTSLSTEDLPFLLDALAKQKDWGVRNLILTDLERIGGAAATDGVLAFLGTDPDRASATRALQALGRLGDDAAAKGLVGYLAEGSDPRLREQAFRSLLATKNESATRDLLATLDSARDVSVKRYTLAALSQIGGEAGAGAVLRYAASTDPAERSLGQRGLRDIRDPAAVPALTDTLARSGDRGLRTEVLRTLGRLKDERAVTPVSQVLYSETDRGLRLEAVRALGQIGNPAALSSLSTVAAGDANPVVRRVAQRTAQMVERRLARSR